MRKVILILAVLSTSCSSKIYNQAHTYRFIETKTLGVNYQGALERTLERKNIKEDTLEFDFTYWGGWKNSKFYSESDTIHITDNGIEQEFIYWTSEGDTVVLDIYKQFNPGSYDDEYKATNGGKVNIEIPQVYELVNILVSLTGNAQPNWVNKDTKYYKRVLEYFEPYKNHPVFGKLNTELSSGSYLNIRENSAAYVLDGQRIVQSSTYAGFRARDKFKKLLPLIQDFATASNFQSFYQSEKLFYEKLESLEHERVQVQEAWEWLQEQFPDKVDSYRIIMSPLAGGSHSIRLFENSNFKENIIFMSAPSLVSKDSVTQSTGDALALRRAFTEMDHNYVNPISDKYNDFINGAMADLRKWNTKGSYNSPYETFNEYMTWAVFGLYVYDRFGESAYKKVMLQPIEFMQNNRGFVKFSAFNNHLLGLFQKYGGKKKVPELYPELLEWVKNENYSS
ncbi:DUF4932 domain-containing protein [Pontibacter silvestris]|uniref:DUF4932 domain-containing protein n=1 Tax=Pontibacter silvestris TaxID=2305183 RepID=A0ABW4WY04_9BACT|nr:DUF4932 domain-containing protein [Pontibacter silvestris]MCC9135260.1 DUF4932 domain-containing protein [Pontibacter silvestris]